MSSSRNYGAACLLARTRPSMSRLPISLPSLLGRTSEIKSPTEINPVGLLVLATSYSRTTFRRTTIGAAAFHFRVRNGNGWGHCARVTRVRCRTGSIAASQRINPIPTSGDMICLGDKLLFDGHRPTLQQSAFKERDFRSAFANRKSAISSGSLISTYREHGDTAPWLQEGNIKASF